MMSTAEKEAHYDYRRQQGSQQKIHRTTKEDNYGSDRDMRQL